MVCLFLRCKLQQKPKYYLYSHKNRKPNPAGIHSGYTAVVPAYSTKILLSFKSLIKVFESMWFWQVIVPANLKW